MSATVRLKPGGIAYRVVELLRSMPVGTVLTTAEIRQHISDYPADNGLWPYLSRAVRAGLVHRDVTNPRCARWSLTPIPADLPPVRRKREKPRPPRFVQRNAEMVDLYREGMRIEAIGQRFGLSRQRVYDILTAAGVDIVASAPTPKPGAHSIGYRAVQRVVPAAKAAKVETSAPRSVFDLGAA